VEKLLSPPRQQNSEEHSGGKLDRHCRYGYRDAINGTECYAPYPTSPWFGPLQRYSVKDLVGDTKLVVEHRVAHIERLFAFQSLRLADYRVAGD
jgi:hypothetical protein